MPDILIESLDDPRLDPYRDLKRPELRATGTLIAEGEKLVRRLLESPCVTESIVCTAAARARFEGLVPADVPIYVTTTQLISRLIGFRFHRGVLACGSRPEAIGIEELCRRATAKPQSVLVLCPEISDPTNLGTIIRTAAAFGAAGLVLGAAGTDPFSRRVLRTSMGTVLRTPIAETEDWSTVLETLHGAEFESIAAVLEPDAEPLSGVPRPRRVALVFGNEDQGLPQSLTARCTRKVMLPMAAAVDSLNVAVAAGIMIHHFAAP